MKPYLIGFGLIFFGLILGYFCCAMCVAAARGREQDEALDKALSKQVSIKFNIIAPAERKGEKGNDDKEVDKPKRA